MYTPPAFREDDPAVLRELMRQARLSTVVTATSEGLMATPLPLILAEDEGENGVLYGHLAKANPQWRASTTGEALVIFSGADAYISPSWYATKKEHGKVVPTWNYAAVHAYGPIEYFEDEHRLRDQIERLTQLYEGARPDPWAVTDAPERFVKAQINGIVGIRIPITRIEGKVKMSQNRSQADRDGVKAGLQGSDRVSDQIVAGLIPGD